MAVVVNDFAAVGHAAVFVILTTGALRTGRRSAGAAYLVATAGGRLAAVAIVVAAPWIAALLGARGLVLARLAGNRHLTGLADTRTPLRIAVTANGLNVLLEAAMVNGIHLGLLGSAWARSPPRSRSPS